MVRKLRYLAKRATHGSPRSRMIEALFSTHEKVDNTVVRYVAAGIIVSIGYTITLVFLMEVLHWSNATMANLLSFLLWTPLSYFAHRQFTFRYEGSDREASTKFLLTTIVKIIASFLGGMLLNEVFGLHYGWTVVLNWIGVPIAAYFILSAWVFPDSTKT